ncbi:MAG TPA: 16S rRNA (guanine(527)-N(7))-methyltransferase RsmG [Syntrophales bacterium]|nr:16S rRNA (guanine(527)-N(7))-methyltransferase RsmG [Syntrophales bacterium]
MEGNFRQILLAAADQMGLSLTGSQIALFEAYRAILLLWNSKMNLVSLQSELDLPVRHFIDSLTLLPYLPAGPRTLLDIGSGAGFPSIPVKIVRKDLHLTLLEASRKKSSFLKEVVRKLDLQGVSVMNGRLEELLKKDNKPSFDLIVSRATLKLQDLVAKSLPLLKEGGFLAAMKGPGADEERAALDSLKSTCFRIVVNHSFTLPLTGDRRNIVLVDKPC